MKKILYLSVLVPFVFLPGCSSQKQTELNPPKNGGIYVVAHRGAHRGIPENSLPAYRKAIELGVDFIEIDVRTTKDGVLVSVHNDDVDSYAKDVTGKVNDFTLNELRTIDIGSRVGAEWAGTQIPTVEEILELCQGKCGVYLDMKEAPVAKLVKLLKKYNMVNDAFWYSPSIRLPVFRKLAKECPRCIAMPDPIYKWLLPVTLQMLHPAVVATTRDAFSPDFARACHEAGAIVIMDEDESSENEWQQVIEWGVDGIQTDDPEGLINFLRRRKSEN
ncbi:MAG TPA: glycerophosphodiester phosphodiesterase family protein [Bacteroidetes bacterium]|nr:glycerophosphodiester phosphodiesterase family protein [Bacteroidota bacterium]